MRRRFFVFLATGLGVGQIVGRLIFFVRRQMGLNAIKKYSGAGLAGSVQGLLLYPFLPADKYWAVLVLVGLTLAAVYISYQAEQVLQTHDDPSIIVDEIVGVMWTLIVLPAGKVPLHVLLLGLILFRIFDVTKLPWKGAQKLPGGWGIVVDDVLAGMLGGLCLRVILCWL